MDAIGSSTRVIWLFIFIYSFPILLLLFSTIIWPYNKFKHLSFIAYIADIIFTAFVLLSDMDNIISKFTRGTPMYHLNLWCLIFLIVSAGFMFISISYYRKKKKVSNICINVSALLCIIVYFTIIHTINM